MNGFVSSAFVKAVSRPMHNVIGSSTVGQRIQGAIAAGVIGGTASRMGGGSFANGARATAFQYLFNEVSEISKAKQNTAVCTDSKCLSYDSKEIILPTNKSRIKWLTIDERAWVEYISAGSKIPGAAGVSIEGAYQFGKIQVAYETYVEYYQATVENLATSNYNVLGTAPAPRGGTIQWGDTSLPLVKREVFRMCSSILHVKGCSNPIGL